MTPNLSGAGNAAILSRDDLAAVPAGLTLTPRRYGRTGRDAAQACRPAGVAGLVRLAPACCALHYCESRRFDEGCRLA